MFTLKKMYDISMSIVIFDLIDYFNETMQTIQKKISWHLNISIEQIFLKSNTGKTLALFNSM